jgi:hypothetical protein
MKDYLGERALCIVCKEALTTIHTELETGAKIFVCEKCLESTKQNFIWICMKCGHVYIRPKSIVLKRLTDADLKEAYRVCEDLQIIQGIDCCLECDPEGIMNIMAAAKSEKTGGHC